MSEETSFPLKKQPVQKRSQFMVSAIKEAAARVLKDQGVDGFNTNTVAEIAGVSIGSLYQYFGSKEVLIAEVKRAHFKELRSLFAQVQQNLKTDRLQEMVDAFIDASVQGHLIDPELHRVLSQDLNHFQVKENDSSEESILCKVESALSHYQTQLRPGLDVSVAAQMVYTLVENTVHDLVLNTNDQTKMALMITELKHIVLVYLQGETSVSR
ncbi:TetR/AcrR family transcriptional regulator [Litoribrevibacter albus]|uniref:TetR family transcriptional regulator n=1 Tax=Litoribrevibacter albus TaxID=1473156 RepID=A0AA37SAG9_9GAMM|nr:TetR/AcrR family transcriptional regulator [Litoribrevibacter albus]GLQ31343.1 TetR family transcriptional regulator [Litoribrevibacter albus]